MTPWLLVLLACGGSARLRQMDVCSPGLWDTGAIPCSDPARSCVWTAEGYRCVEPCGRDEDCERGSCQDAGASCMVCDNIVSFCLQSLL